MTSGLPPATQRTELDTVDYGSATGRDLDRLLVLFHAYGLKTLKALFVKNGHAALRYVPPADRNAFLTEIELELRPQ